MTARNIHRTVGLILLLPLLGWVITAMVFYIKPGYAGAYEFLEPRTYPLREPLPALGTDSTRLEIRFVKTILGLHAIVRTRDGVVQLDPQTLRPREKPDEEQIRMLLNDAFLQNPDRYGRVEKISGDSVTTTTHVLVILDWKSLTLSQRGADTDRIDMLYKIHYLQLTGIKALDRILGPLGLTLVTFLSILGIRLALQSRTR